MNIDFRINTMPSEKWFVASEAIEGCIHIAQEAV
jgi:hypothetical protein